jgi:hypothetical protein
VRAGVSTAAAAASLCAALATAPVVPFKRAHLAAAVLRPWIVAAFICTATAAYAAEDDGKIHPTCIEENNTCRCWVDHGPPTGVRPPQLQRRHRTQRSRRWHRRWCPFRPHRNGLRRRSSSEDRMGR